MICTNQLDKFTVTLNKPSLPNYITKIENCKNSILKKYIIFRFDQYFHVNEQYEILFQKM